MSTGLVLTFLLTSGFSSEDSAKNDESGICIVNITYTNQSTGQSWTESWYSYDRTSQADCEAGAQALVSGNIFQSSDFSRSPVILAP